MKIKYILCYPILASIFLLACSAPRMVNLDPVTVIENSKGSTVYRGSYTKHTDILNTRLDLSFDWDSAYVIGKATIFAKPYFYPTDQLVLNANGFRINSVSLVNSYDKKPLRYTYDGKLLRISLDKIYNRDQKYTVFIDYVAMPNKLKIGEDIASAGDRGFYFINRDGKEKGKPRQIWTQGETECNSNWFPTINGTQEKMTQELNITVPNEFVSLSNGTLEFSSMNGDGTRTDSWRQEQPHSTYLTMLAVGDFAITKDIVTIMIGLGIGAMFVRSLTIYLVEKGTLDTYIFLEHGAHYAIGILAFIMLLSTKLQIPEVLTGLIGISFILLSLYSSIKYNKNH